MADLPILFSAPMVRALIEGRKTQTRRVLKPQPVGHVRRYGWSEGYGASWSDDVDGHRLRIWAGDRLWVRESVTRFDKGTCDQYVWYRSGHNLTNEPADSLYRKLGLANDDPWPKDREGPAGGAAYSVPSIHMPRWASRITLTVTDVRIERLQDISEADAIAEGVVKSETSFEYDEGHGVFEELQDWFNVPGVPDPGCGTSAADMFATLWGHVNGAGAWDENPWIVAYSFSVALGNIDQIGGDA